MDSCHSIRQLLVAYFSAQVEVVAANDQCVITLPLKTIDDRFIDVWVQPKLAGHVTVHDGGKTMAELFAQGVHLTSLQVAQIEALSRRAGVTVQDGVIQTTCPVEHVQSAVFTIAQCAALAMVPLLSHEPVYEDEALTTRVGRALKKWKPDYVDLRRRLKVKGKLAQHSFDWVSFPRRKGLSIVSIKLLPPGYGALVQARQYGFLAYDTEGRESSKWSRLAIVSRIEEWPKEALEVVRDLSTDTIELETGEEERIERLLPRKMNALTKAA